MKTVVLLLAMAVALLAQKKAKPEPEPPKTYPTERTLAAPCDAAWPAAIQVLAANGWAIKTSDRAGGLLTFDRTTVERMKSYKDFVTKYTTGKTTGFWTMWSDFRFGGSQAIFTPRDGKCSLSFMLKFEGFGKQGGAYSETGWWTLPSNGWFEDKMLNEIEAKVASSASK